MNRLFTLLLIGFSLLSLTVKAQTFQEISLRVYDDGVGFDTSIEKSGSYGLMNIKERVQGMGGSLKIISFPNKGTVIEIRIPNTNMNKNSASAE